MRLLKDKNSSNGFTLVEVLASIVILSIIFTVFFPFFVQAMNYSSRIQQNMEIVNLARQVHSNILDNETIFTVEGSYPSPTTYNVAQMDTLQVDRYGYFNSNNKYYVSLHISKGNDFERLKLMLVRMKIFNQENQEVFETYCYMKGT